MMSQCQTFIYSYRKVKDADVFAKRLLNNKCVEVLFLLTKNQNDYNIYME